MCDFYSVKPVVGVDVSLRAMLRKKNEAIPRKVSEHKETDDTEGENEALQRSLIIRVAFRGSSFENYTSV